MFLQCILSGAKMLMGLFFLGWTSMNVARNDIITQISGLVGNLQYVLVNFTSAGDIIKSYQDLPPSVNIAGPVRSCTVW